MNSHLNCSTRRNLQAIAKAACELANKRQWLALSLSHQGLVSLVLLIVLTLATAQQVTPQTAQTPALATAAPAEHVSARVRIDEARSELMTAVPERSTGGRSFFKRAALRVLRFGKALFSAFGEGGRSSRSSKSEPPTEKQFNVKIDGSWQPTNVSNAEPVNRVAPETAAADVTNLGDSSSINLFLVKVAGRTGFIDDSGRLVISPQFDTSIGCKEARCGVWQKGKWGYIDLRGTLVIAPSFTEASNFAGGLAAVKIGEQWGYVDRVGTIQVKPQFVAAGNFSENLAWVVPKGLASYGYVEGKRGFINTAGDVILQPAYDDANNFAEGYAAVRRYGKWTFIDHEGRPISDYVFDWAHSFSQGLAAVGLNGKAAYIDKTGSLQFSSQYDDAQSFSEGLAAVEIDGKWAYINLQGKIVLPPKYPEVRAFSEGLAAVKDAPSSATVKQTAGSWGYINTKGEYVMKPRFDRALSFEDGLGWVVSNGRQTYVNKKGAIIWEARTAAEARLVSGLDWVPVTFRVNDKEQQQNYKILLYVDDREIEPMLVDGGFLVPPEVKTAKTTEVRFQSGTYDLFFGALHPAKFTTDWTVGVDTKPFDPDNLRDEAPGKIQIIYYIDFESKLGDGTRLVIAVSKAKSSQ